MRDHLIAFYNHTLDFQIIGGPKKVLENSLIFQKIGNFEYQIKKQINGEGPNPAPRREFMFQISKVVSDKSHRAISL